jgi:serine/threonine-protein kinase
VNDKTRTSEDQETALAPLQERQAADGRDQNEGQPDPLVEKLIRAALPEPDTELQFEEIIRRGGEGSIAVAFDPTLQRRVAVKTMHKNNVAEPLLVRGFLREAQIIAQLEHPNIVAIHQLADDTEAGLHFSMGLIEGRNLTEFLAAVKEPDHQSLIDFLEIIIKVCNALSFAHSRGVVHCDLKPANIMVGDHGQVYVMDWGGAQLMSSQDPEPVSRFVRDTLPELPSETTQGMVFGTPAYMAPEQARGEAIDERADIFSIGAMLYKFITGRAPFHSESTTVGIQHAQVCHYRPLDERLYAGVLPHGLFSITERAMAAKVDDRFQTIAEFRKALRSLIHGSGSFPTVTFSAGETIIDDGDHGDAGYIIARGEVEVFKNIDGNRVSIKQLSSGDVFGETAIFAASPRTASVVALTEVKLVQITEDVVHAELKAMKPWMASFVRMLAERFRESEMLRLKGDTQN